MLTMWILSNGIQRFYKISLACVFKTISGSFQDSKQRTTIQKEIPLKSSGIKAKGTIPHNFQFANTSVIMSLILLVSIDSFTDDSGIPGNTIGTHQLSSANKHYIMAPKANYKNHEVI